MRYGTVSELAGTCVVCYDIHGACASSMHPVGNCGEEPNSQEELSSTIVGLKPQIECIIKTSRTLGYRRFGDALELTPEGDLP